MEMTNEQVQQASKAIKSLTKKACAMLRARKLKVTDKQKEVLSEIINDQNGSAINGRTYEALLRKGYIIKKSKYQFNTSHYLINF